MPGRQEDAGAQEPDPPAADERAQPEREPRGVADPLPQEERAALEVDPGGGGQAGGQRSQQVAAPGDRRHGRHGKGGMAAHQRPGAEGARHGRQDGAAEVAAVEVAGQFLEYEGDGGHWRVEGGRQSRGGAARRGCHPFPRRGTQPPREGRGGGPAGIDGRPLAAEARAAAEADDAAEQLDPGGPPGKPTGVAAVGGLELRDAAAGRARHHFLEQQADQQRTEGQGGERTGEEFGGRTAGQDRKNAPVEEVGSLQEQHGHERARNGIEDGFDDPAGTTGQRPNGACGRRVHMSLSQIGWWTSGGGASWSRCFSCAGVRA